MLTVNILGGFSLVDSSGRDFTPRSGKACCLIGYFALTGLRRERRDRLAGLLWSESASKQAFDSLRHCIAELRDCARRSGIAFLDADRQAVQIDQEFLNCDRLLLSDALARRDIGRCREILARPDLSPLLGLEAGDDGFDNWLTIERERRSEALVQEILAAMRDRSLTARDRGDLAAAVERLDPYQEEAIRLHMEALRDGGDVSAAIATYERYCGRLSREFEVEPSDDLSALHEDLIRLRKNGRGGPVKRAGIASPPERHAGARSSGNDQLAAAVEQRTPTIAVSSHKGSREDTTWDLAEAFRHELVGTLCRFKEWSVFALSDPDALAEDFSLKDHVALLASEQVDYALVVSASKIAESLSIHVQLIDCGTATVLISDQYPAAPVNWMAVFNDICCRIASRTQLTIAAARLRRIPRSSPENQTAYDLWLEGETLSWMWTSENEARAAELFEQATVIDPNLACAYGSWAAVLNSRWIVHPGSRLDAAESERALELAKRAVALDPMDCRNHMHLGWCHILARRFDPGELHFRLRL